MSDISQLMITDFIFHERRYLQRVEEEIRIVPMTYEQKLFVLEELLKRGIKFGIEKGIFIEQERVKKITSAKSKFVEKYVDELVFSLNFRMAAYRDLPKIKYSKRKYRLRKKLGGEQLEIKFVN